MALPSQGSIIKAFPDQNQDHGHHCHPMIASDTHLPPTGSASRTSFPVALLMPVTYFVLAGRLRLRVPLPGLGLQSRDISLVGAPPPGARAVIGLVQALAHGLRHVAHFSCAFCTLCLRLLHTLSASFVHFVCAFCTLCLRLLHTLSAPFVHFVCAFFILCLRLLHSLSVPFVHFVCVFCTLCMCLLHTLSVPSVHFVCAFCKRLLCTLSASFVHEGA